MILIADSGSTKTQWILSEQGKEIQNITTAGMNPNFTAEDVIDSIILSVKDNLSSGTVEKIFFYGSGCSNKQNKQIIFNYLNQYFPKATIEIEHDLLAAARAACGKEKGIAVILGTGSSSCLFDGEKIVDAVPSLGYVLGDEGSGCYIGKRLLQAFIYQEMPQELYAKFESQYPFSVSDITDHVYKKPAPNRFLAEFTLFAEKNIKHPFCYELVKNSFNDFFIIHVNKYQTNSEICINSIGSVGYFFQDILKEVAAAHGKKVKNIYQTPNEGLLKYHAND